MPRNHPIYEQGYADGYQSGYDFSLEAQAEAISVARADLARKK